MRATAEGRPTVGKKPAKMCVNAGFVLADDDSAGEHRYPDIFPSKLRGYEQKLDIRPVRRVSQPTMTKPTR
jgi:hypothetical protein